MQNLRKPAFYLGIAAHIVFLFGLGLKAKENEYSNYVIWAGFLLGGIFWIWSIFEVIAANDLKKYQKTFWLIIVIAVPMFGGLVFHLLHQNRNNIAA